MKKLLASALLVLIPFSAQAACSASDFSVKNFQIKRQAGNRVSIKGMLVNHCATPAGAQIRISAKSASGNVLVYREIWPAGTTNLAPGGSAKFDAGRLFHYRASMKKFAVSVVTTRSW